MKKNTRKLFRRSLLVALILALMVPMFTACKPADGGQATDPPTGGAQPTKAPTAAPTAAPTDAPPTEPKFGKIVIWSNEGGPWNAPVPSDPEYLERLHDYILENAGVDVEVILPPKDSDAATQRLAILLSGNEQMDAFKGNVNNYYAKGAIQPLDDALAKYGQPCFELWPETYGGGWAGTKGTDGKIYGIPNLPSLAGATIYLNKHMMEKSDLDTTKLPTSMEELYTILKTFQEKDPAGDGQTIPMLLDLYGMNMTMAAGYMDQGLDWNMKGCFDKTDQKYKPYVFADGYKDFITEMAKWYSEGLIYKEAFTINRERQMELIGMNRVAATALWYTTVTTPLRDAWQADDTVDLLVPAELKGPTGYSKSITDTGIEGWMVPKKSKMVDSVVAYIAWLQSDVRNYHTVHQGFEGDYWKLDEELPGGKYAMVNIPPPEGQNKKYYGDFFIGGSFAMTQKIVSRQADGRVMMDLQYIEKHITDTVRTRQPATMGFSFLFDLAKIEESVSRTDMNTKIASELTKFVMGTRPLDEWDAFLEELKEVGLDAWIEAFTEQYNTHKIK
ncbi:MAG: extracellular solute-binding protein [Clostridiaceae bacterium]|nr:extracellular solute-binding protein [Clostridiaceae bacterium]